MNKIRILSSVGIIAIIAIAILLMTKGSVKAPIQSVSIEEDGHQPISGSGVYMLNLSNSLLKAHGNKPFISGYTDNSVAKFKEGYMTLDEGLISGNFKVDMNSIAIESTGKGTGESLLEKHLKSPDFFNVEKYPESMFEIKSAEKTNEDNLYMITGDLTLKGKTQSITFPTVIYMKNNQLKAEGTIELDRIKWDIKYGSGTFFKNLGDNLISNIFTVEFNITANPKK